MAEVLSFSSLLVVSDEIGGNHEGGGAGAQLLGRHWRERGRVPRSEWRTIHLGAPADRPLVSQLEPPDRLQERELLERTRAALLRSLVIPGRVLVFSATHAVTPAIVSAARQHTGQQSIGLVWCDAHPDLHTISSSPSARLHGMSLALSLGLECQDSRDWEEFRGCLQLPRGSVSAVCAGIRDTEAAEEVQIESLHIPVCSVDDIRRDPSQAARCVLHNFEPQQPIVVSFDVDFVDANILPGSASPSWLGPNTIEAGIFLRVLLEDPRVVVFEVTEYNVAFDVSRFGLHQVLMLTEFAIG